MKLAFVSTIIQQPTPTGDATAWHAALPRPMRKTLRLPSVKTKSHTEQGVDSYFLYGYRTDAYHNTNLVETDPLTDEFGDIDNEYEGLTITESMDEAQLFHFCTGYDIL